MALIFLKNSRFIYFSALLSNMHMEWLSATKHWRASRLFSQSISGRCTVGRYGSYFDFNIQTIRTSSRRVACKGTVRSAERIRVHYIWIGETSTRLLLNHWSDVDSYVHAIRRKRINFIWCKDHTNNTFPFIGQSNVVLLHSRHYQWKEMVLQNYIQTFKTQGCKLIGNTCTYLNKIIFNTSLFLINPIVFRYKWFRGSWKIVTM